MKRRDFLKSTAAFTGGIFSGLHKATAQSPGAVPGPQPNIVFILVDELRYPTVFPDHIKTPDEFLRQFMPNVHKRIWKQGVKFGNHHTAGNACTPSRGVLITGLYSQQQWLITTILSTPYPNPPTLPQPVLNRAYPTYGKLLQAAGYQTPYVGKWHVSVPKQPTNTLANYGFDYWPTYYDPTGDNFQGTYGDPPDCMQTNSCRGYHNDAYSASQGIDWLKNKRPVNQPWCLTVSLVNPHDREFFPAGTEFQTAMNLFADANPAKLQPMAAYWGDTYEGPLVDWNVNELKSPKSYGYPTVPPNWENASSLATKPSTQAFIREFSQGIWGGVSDDPSQNTASIEQYPNDLQQGVVKMPYSYWQRGLDSYTQVMQIVDTQIGNVLDALHELPQDVRENTIIIFASDHGEYSGAHGFVQGKIGTVYEEAWHVPLIVYDPSGRYTGDVDTIRTGLTSHVDFMPLLASIGALGTREWMTGRLAEIYGERHDMISMLKSASAPGRSYVLYATDEIVPDIFNFNFNKSPTHILGLRTEDTKLGVYSKWVPPLTSDIIPSSIELEFYDYSTTGGKLELDNLAFTNPGDPRIQSTAQLLLSEIVPNELQAKLPGTLGEVQKASKIAHLLFRDFIALKPSGSWRNGGLQKLLGYGREF